MDKGHYEKAQQVFDAAIAQDPKAWPLYLNRSNVFVISENSISLFKI